MKRFTHYAFLAFLIAAVAAPVLIAAEKDSADKETVVKRIFVRDGEVIEIDSSPEGLRILPELGNRTFLGVQTIDITEDLRSHFRAPAEQGVLVSAVSESSPAAAAGVRAGDVIVSIDGEPVSSAGKLRRLIREHEKGDAIQLEVIRSGARQRLYATLDEKTMEFPRIEMRGDAGAFRYRLDKADPSLKKLQEYFASPEWETRVNKLPNCAEIQAKLEVVQKRLGEMEKRLEKMK